MKNKIINIEEFQRCKNSNDSLDNESLDIMINPKWDDLEELWENNKSNKIVLNDVSAGALIRKIEHDKKNPTFIKDNNIEEKLEEGKRLLKQLFGEKEDILYKGYNVTKMFIDKEYRQQVFEHYDSKYKSTQEEDEVFNDMREISERIYTLNEDSDDIDEKAIEGISEGLNDMKLMRDGKLPKQTIDEFLRELDENPQSKCTNKYKESLKNMTKEDFLAIEELLNE